MVHGEAGGAGWAWFVGFSRPDHTRSSWDLAYPLVMYLLMRFLPFVLAVMTTVGVEYGIARAPRFMISHVAVLLAVFIGSMIILRRSSWSERLILSSPPLVFLAGSGFALFFIAPPVVTHAVSAVLGLSVWVYFEEIYRYVYQPHRYHQHSIEHLAGYLGLLALAGSMAGIFALRIFFTIRLIYLLPLTFIIAIVVSAAVLAVQPLSRVSLLSSVLVFGTLVTEMTLAVHFLPSNYWVNSLMVTIPFYVALHLIRHELSGTISRDIIQRYSVIGVIALALIVSTAQWIL